MQLIGILSSPYVRRVAISLQFLGVPFVHRPISVFSMQEEFKQINPLLKTPTIVCDDGEVLMDSSLILEYAEGLATTSRSLMPKDAASRQHAFRVIGLALAACEKSVQIYYERTQRPVEKQHESWLNRITGQVLAAYDALEAELGRQPAAMTSATIDQAGITTAVAWKFTQEKLADVVNASHYPVLIEHSKRAELLAEFRAAPHGSHTYPHTGK